MAISGDMLVRPFAIEDNCLRLTPSLCVALGHAQAKRLKTIVQEG